jgi:hypothetical protein
MNSLSRAKPDPHTKRLLVDEAEWRDRLNQLADMRRGLAVPPAATGATIVVASGGERRDTTAGH